MMKKNWYLKIAFFVRHLDWFIPFNHIIQTQIIAVHYGVITNMAAIALIHLFIYECINLSSLFVNRERYVRSYDFVHFYCICSEPLIEQEYEKKWFPPFSRAYNSSR